MMQKTTICVHNPPLLMRRPISDLVQLLQEQFTFTILTPQTPKTQKLHHEQKQTTYVTYNTFTPPGGYAWPIPGASFLSKLSNLYQKNTIFHTWTNAYPSVVLLITYVKLKNLFVDEKEKRKIVISLDTIPAETFKFNSILDPLFKCYNATFGKVLLNAADAVTIYSEELRPILKKQGIKTPIHYTPTGIEQKNLPKELPKHTTTLFTKLKKLHPQKKLDYVFMLGIPNKRKGTDILLDIAKRMPQQQFVHVGDGNELEYWKTQAKEQHITNICFLGIRNDVPQLVQNATCVLLPSRGEGLAGIIMEGMLYGSPVVTSNIFGTRELITHNKEGLLVPTEATHAYVNAITKIKTNPELRKKLITNAKQKIKQFSWTKNKKRFAEVYKCVE